MAAAPALIGAAVNIGEQLKEFSAAHLSYFCRALSAMIYDTRDRYTSSSGARRASQQRHGGTGAGADLAALEATCVAWPGRHVGVVRLQGTRAAHDRPHDGRPELGCGDATPLAMRAGSRTGA